jgi:hypothetical protein
MKPNELLRRSFAGEVRLEKVVVADMPPRVVMAWLRPLSRPGGAP